MDSVLRDVADADITRLCTAMERDGVGILPGCLSADVIGRATEFVTRELARNGGEYFSAFGRAALAGSPMVDLGGAPPFRRILATLYARHTGCVPPDSAILHVLRVLSGGTGLKHSFRFHYDAYVVTALMPILIPDAPGEKRGDLVIYPNLRGIRRFAPVNLAEKALLQNRAAARLFAAPATQRALGARVVRMQPGNLYFFWGYQSLHANEPCLPRSVRATALFHFADPHAGSTLVRFIEQRHRSRTPAGLAAPSPPVTNL